MKLYCVYADGPTKEGKFLYLVGIFDKREDAETICNNMKTDNTFEALTVAVETNTIYGAWFDKFKPEHFIEHSIQTKNTIIGMEYDA